MVEELLAQVEESGDAVYRVDFRRLGRWPYVNLPVPEEVLEAEEKFGPLRNRSSKQKRRTRKKNGARQADTQPSGSDRKARAPAQAPRPIPKSRPEPPTNERQPSRRRRRRRHHTHWATAIITILVFIFNSEGLVNFARALPQASEIPDIPGIGETHPAAQMGKAYDQGSKWVVGATTTWHAQMTHAGAVDLRNGLLNAFEALNKTVWQTNDLTHENAKPNRPKDLKAEPSPARVAGELQLKGYMD